MTSWGKTRQRNLNCSIGRWCGGWCRICSMRSSLWTKGWRRTFSRFGSYWGERLGIGLIRRGPSTCRDQGGHLWTHFLRGERINVLFWLWRRFRSGRRLSRLCSRSSWRCRSLLVSSSGRGWTSARCFVWRSRSGTPQLHSNRLLSTWSCWSWQDLPKLSWRHRLLRFCRPLSAYLSLVLRNCSGLVPKHWCFLKIFQYECDWRDS